MDPKTEKKMSKAAEEVLSKWHGRVSLVQDNDDPNVRGPVRYGITEALGTHDILVSWGPGPNPARHAFDRDTGLCVESSDGAMGGWRIAPWEMHRFSVAAAEARAAEKAELTMNIGTAEPARGAPVPPDNAMRYERLTDMLIAVQAGALRRTADLDVRIDLVDEHLVGTVGGQEVLRVLCMDPGPALVQALELFGVNSTRKSREVAAWSAPTKTRVLVVVPPAIDDVGRYAKAAVRAAARFEIDLSLAEIDLGTAKHGVSLAGYRPEVVIMDTPTLRGGHESPWYRSTLLPRLGADVRVIALPTNLIVEQMIHGR